MVVPQGRLAFRPVPVAGSTAERTAPRAACKPVSAALRACIRTLSCLVELLCTRKIGMSSALSDMAIMMTSMTIGMEPRSSLQRTAEPVDSGTPHGRPPSPVFWQIRLLPSFVGELPCPLFMASKVTVVWEVVAVSLALAVVVSDSVNRCAVWLPAAVLNENGELVGTTTPLARLSQVGGTLGVPDQLRSCSCEL